MPLNIKNERAHQLAHELAQLTGESITEAVTQAIAEAVERRQAVRKRHIRSLIEDLTEIADYTASLPVKDGRTAEEIIGYDDRGLPGSW